MYRSTLPFLSLHQSAEEPKWTLTWERGKWERIPPWLISSRAPRGMSCGVNINPLAHMTQGILLRMTNIFTKWSLEQMVKHFGEIPLEIRALAEPVQLAPISTSQYGGGSKRCVHWGRDRERKKDEENHVWKCLEGSQWHMLWIWMLVTSMGCWSTPVTC